MAKGEVVAVRRLTGEKITLKRRDAPAQLLALLEKTHQDMLDKCVFVFLFINLCNVFIYL